MVKKIMNLTPHGVALANAAGEITATLQPSGKVARMAVNREETGTLMGLPVSTSVFGEVVGLPDPAPETIYLVSTLIAQAVRRRDVVSPDTGPSAVRKDGQVVAVRGFQAF